MNGTGLSCLTAAPIVLMIVATPVSAAPVSAQILLDKSLSLEGAWASNIFGNEQQIADDVTLVAPALANHLTWYGNRQLSANFVVRIFADEASLPAASPFYDQSLGLVTGVDTGLNDVHGRDIYEYSSTIPPVALGGSTRYWLTIASTDAALWSWSHAHAGPSPVDGFSRYGESARWQSIRSFGWSGDSLEKAFRLERVPEPSSFAIAGLLLAAFPAYRTHEKARHERGILQLPRPAPPQPQLASSPLAECGG